MTWGEHRYMNSDDGNRRPDQPGDGSSMWPESRPAPEGASETQASIDDTDLQSTAEERADRRERNEEVEDAADNHVVSEDIFPADLGEEMGPPAGEGDPEDDLTPVRPIVGLHDTVREEEKTTMRLEIPIRTIVKVALSLLAIWLLLKVTGIILQVFLAFLLATAMLPLVRRLRNRGMGKAAASGVVFLGLVGAIVGFFWIVLPPLLAQAQSIITNAPEYLQRFEEYIARYPSLNEQYQNLLESTPAGNGEGNGGGADAAGAVSQAIEVSANIVTTLANTFFVLILTFYLMIEGDSAWKFLSRYFTPRLRYRIRRSYPEITRVVSGYIIGQSINSLSFGVFAFITLWFFDVPEKLLLAALAAVFDAVPIVGVPVATIPAVALALTQGVDTALFVLIAYVVYQQFENYVMVPRVFGNTLSVSSLSILVGVLIGGQLLGVVGIILSLPITAAIPVLERVWNEDLPDDIAEAERQEMAAATEAREKEEREAAMAEAAAKHQRQRRRILP